MATLDDDLIAAGLELFDLPGWETRLPIRQLWIAPSFWEWFDSVEALHEIRSGSRTLGEHIEQMFCDLRCSERPGAGDVRKMMPSKKQVWKLHPPKSRLYAWAARKECLVVMTGALESDTKDKTGGNLNNKKRDEVIAFIKAHRLTKTYSQETILPSFRPKPNPRRRMFLKLAGLIESQLRDAYARRYEEGKLTQASIARELGVNRSAVHNRLSGRANMTLETIADMVWALGHDIDVKISDPAMKADTNYFVADDDCDESVDSNSFVRLRDATNDNGRRRVEYAA
jgi:transcriptional regulator with XRE-family HTH domain